MRATRATELAGKYPSFLRAEWLGHTEAVAEANYRRATDEHYREAALFETGQPMAQICTQQAPERAGSTVCVRMPENKKNSVLPEVSRVFLQVGKQPVPATGAGSGWRMRFQRLGLRQLKKMGRQKIRQCRLRQRLATARRPDEEARAKGVRFESGVAE